MNTLLLKCPKCTKNNPYSSPSPQPVLGSHELVCAHCHTKFTAWIVVIRAKRSHRPRINAYSYGPGRYYSIRVIDGSQREHLIEFGDGSWDDFELRSKDIAVFSYVKGKLKLVQNLTIQTWMQVTGQNQVIIATLLILLLILIVFVIINFLFPSLTHYIPR